MEKATIRQYGVECLGVMSLAEEQAIPIRRIAQNPLRIHHAVVQAHQNVHAAHIAANMPRAGGTDHIQHVQSPCPRDPPEISVHTQRPSFHNFKASR